MGNDLKAGTSLYPSLDDDTTAAAAEYPGPVEFFDLDNFFHDDPRYDFVLMLVLFELRASEVECMSSSAVAPLESHGAPTAPTSPPSFLDRLPRTCSITVSRNFISCRMDSTFMVSTLASLSKVAVSRSQLDTFSSTLFSFVVLTFHMSLGTKSLFEIYPPRGWAIVW